MDGNAIVLNPGETMATAERYHFTAPLARDFLQRALGDSFQVVPSFDFFKVLDGMNQRKTKCVVFCHEYRTHLHHNSEAQRLWQACVGRPVNSLNGPVVIVYGDDDFMRGITGKYLPVMATAR